MIYDLLKFVISTKCMAVVSLARCKLLQQNRLRHACMHTLTRTLACSRARKNARTHTHTHVNCAVV